MKFRLKDALLQEQLDEISLGGFSEALYEVSKAIEEKFAEPTEQEIYVKFDKAGDHFSLAFRRFVVGFRAQELEPIGEFDPKAWNVYDGVQPPTRTWLAVEWKDDDDVKHGTRAMYAFDKESCGWWFFDDYGEPLPREARDILFKPWDADV